MEFLDGAPLAAFRAAAQPFRPAPAVFGDIKGVLVRDDGEITVSGFERLTDMKE